ncbi:MAG: hypothetical protein ACUZ8E_07145 [Candidatus Anammoxibacter sp.]
MNKKKLLRLGLPLRIENKAREAIIELNTDDCVVVNEGGSTFYLKDINLKEWIIANPFKRLIYFFNQQQ